MTLFFCEHMILEKRYMIIFVQNFYFCNKQSISRNCFSDLSIPKITHRKHPCLLVRAKQWILSRQFFFSLSLILRNLCMKLCTVNRLWLIRFEIVTNVMIHLLLLPLNFIRSSDTPVQTVRSVVCVSGGPGSVSTGTQASSGKSGPASTNARALC